MSPRPGMPPAGIALDSIEISFSSRGRSNRNRLGSYGLLTITKSISILGDGHGGIAASGGATDKINLRGVVIEGFGTGSSGIVFNTGASLNIQDSIIRNFASIGIIVQPTAATPQLNVSGTLVSDLGTGIAVDIHPTGSGSVNAVLDHVELDSSFNGLLVLGDNTSGSINATMADSVVSNYNGPASPDHRAKA